MASPPTLSRYGYDPRTRRYRDSQTGQFISPGVIRKAVDTLLDTETATIRKLAQQLRDGQVSLPEWQVQMTNKLKTIHVAVGLAANGGLKNTSNADLGFLASQIKAQYVLLRDFAIEVKSGKQPLDGTLVSRSALYVQSARGTYETMVGRAARNAGAQLSRSVLGIADHCPLCVQEAAKGWSPLGSLIPIGERTCLANCHCRMEYK